MLVLTLKPAQTPLKNGQKPFDKPLIIVRGGRKRGRGRRKGDRGGRMEGGLWVRILPFQLSLFVLFVFVFV